MRKLINVYDSNPIAIISGEKRVTFDDMLRRITLFASVGEKTVGAKTIILAENREAWIYSLYSVWQNKGIAVPVDATCTSHDIAYIVNDCTPECIWTTKKKIDLVQQGLKEAGRDVRILMMDDYEEAPLTDQEPADLPCEMEDTALICYTSGTTGSPKGVMLTYRNIMANIDGVSREVKIFSKDIRTIILLPLHHVLPLVGSIMVPFETGGGVAICPSLTGPDIMDTLQRGKIGLMIGVPRLWATLYNGIMKKINSNPVTKFLFWLCDKVDSYKFSSIVFASVKKKMGGIQFLVSGGAALDKDIARGLKVLGLNLLEGYGMTETAPIIAFTRPFGLVPGSVGYALPSVEVKLVDGEICARGKNVMKGYYNRPEETAAIIDSDGFVHTGDLARIDPDGRIYITGRKKEILVTPGGKNINPVEIEFKLEKNVDVIKECAVTLNGENLTAIIVPQDDLARDMSDEELEKYYKENIIQPYNQDIAPYKKIVSVYIYRGDLPRTKMEKLQRFKLNDILKSGSHKAARNEDFVEPQFEEYQIVKNYLLEEKKLDQIRPTDNIETDLGCDSLDKIGLQGFIEQTFGLKLTAEEVSRFKSVQELAEHIADYKTRIEVAQTDWSTLLKEEGQNVSVPNMWSSGPVIAHGFNRFLKCYGGMEVKGLENIPQSGNYILAPNHQSYLDGLLVPGCMKSKDIKNLFFYAKLKHVQGAVKKYLAGHHGIIIMDMSTLKDSIQQLGEVLKTGHSLCIFPEGTRTKTGKVGKFKKTFAILSKELDVPVVPVVIRGAFEAMPKGSKFIKKQKIEVEFLPVVSPSSAESYEDFADRVRMMICEKIK